MPRDGEPTTDDEPTSEHRPLIDVSPALHEAGHEVADLGFEGVPDDGPLTTPAGERAGPEDPLDFVNVQMPSD